MVFKSTGLDSRFQRKKRFWKICTESRDIDQNVSNFAWLVWKADFGNILGLSAYFSKPIFALKPWVQAGWFEYHETLNMNKFFFAFKGGGTKLKNHKIARHSAGNALKFPIFFLLHSYYPYVCSNSTTWSNSKIRFFWNTLLYVCFFLVGKYQLFSWMGGPPLSGKFHDNNQVF